MSDTPYTDYYETDWSDFVGTNLKVVEVNRCRKLELDRAVLLGALKNAADALDKPGHTFQADLAYSWIEEVKSHPEPVRGQSENGKI